MTNTSYLVHRSFRCPTHGLSDGVSFCIKCESLAAARMDIIGTNGPTGDHYEPGVKYDGEKPMMDLIPPLMELEVAKVLTVGAQKYSPDNWRKVPDMRRRYIAAAKRHINALSQGIALDDETGLHHAAHAVCCLMFLGEIELESGSAESVPFA